MRHPNAYHPNARPLLYDAAARIPGTSKKKGKIFTGTE